MVRKGLGLGGQKPAAAPPNVDTRERLKNGDPLSWKLMVTLLK